MNPLFNLLSNQINNPMMQTIQRFNQFRQQYQGNPQQAVQEMLNSGKITQDQYNAAVQQANTLRQFLGI